MSDAAADISAVQLRVISSLSLIAAEDWDACANPDGAVYNPFLRHAFLLALEESGSATAENFRSNRFTGSIADPNFAEAERVQ